MTMGKTTRIIIQRWPANEGEEMSHYEVPLDEDMTLLQALNYIYDNLDRSLAFRRYCCGGHFCGSCLMEVNGKAAYACVTKLVPEQSLVVKALSGHEIIKDLIVKLDGLQ